MLDQWERLLLQLAEARRMDGTQDRFGTVHQVWRQNKEQKVRINMGNNPDGEPWLSPWLKVDSHHGATRTQKKFHKGQNVKISAVGADFRNATVASHGENKDHPEPDHADDIHETTQYGTSRTRTGPDFEERWLASAGQLNGQDPDQVSVALTRWGAKPSNQQDKNQPWDGPDPKAGDPKKQHLNWAGTPGTTPAVTGDAMVHQFDKDSKIEVVMGSVLKKIQSPDGGNMSSPDAGDGSATRTTTDAASDGNHTRKVKDNASGKTTSTVHSNGDVTHIVQDLLGNVSRITQQMKQTITQMKGADGSSSTMLMQAAKMFMQVTDASGKSSSIQISGGAITLNSAAVNINTDGPSSPPSPLTIPSVNASGDAALIVIPTLWQASANLTAVTNLPQKHVGAVALTAATTMQAGLLPLRWLAQAGLAPVGHLNANPVPAKFTQVWGMTVEPRITLNSTQRMAISAHLSPAVGVHA
jgi:hypothetical protein